MKKSNEISVPLTVDEISLITKAMSDGLNYRKLGFDALSTPEFEIMCKLKFSVVRFLNEKINDKYG